MSGKENDPNAADPEVYECRIYGLLPYIPKVTYCRHEFCKNLQVKNKKGVGNRPKAPKGRQMFKHLYIWIFLWIY